MILSCKDVSIAYDNFTAVRDVSFDAVQGDYICILGENGSGKTSLMRAILGLLPIKSGKLITDFKGVGYVSQQKSVANDFPASVQEIVLTGCLCPSSLFCKKEHRLFANEKMKEMGIFELRKRPFRELSGGQRQRVLLARALCAAKDILFLDEPSAGLDARVTAELYQILKEQNKHYNLTVVMVSHDISAAVKYADKILHIENKMLFYGSTDDYIDSDVGKRFLGGERQ